LEALPYANESFDVVTGINAFQFAADPLRALREARRVVRCGGAVVVATWGRTAECEAVAFLAALRPEGSPPPAPSLPGWFNLSEGDALDTIAQAGLRAVFQEDVAVPFEYPDLSTALRGLLSTGPAQAAMSSQGEEPVRRRVGEALQPFRTPAGGYRLQNKFPYAVTTPV
jgi:SAM-dependent methyltransferase